MARIPCAFSVQEEFLRQIDARAAQLGMKRSEFVLQALRKELLLNRGSSMSIVAESGIPLETIRPVLIPSLSEKRPRPLRKKKDG